MELHHHHHHHHRGLVSISGLWDVTCHIGSHSVTFHPPQVNTPGLNNPSQTGQYSIYLPQRDGRLSWPRWPVTHRDGLPAHRRSPIPIQWRRHTRCV